MKIKQTILAITLMMGIGMFLSGPVAFAAIGDVCTSTTPELTGLGQVCCGGVVAQSCCAGVPTSIIGCDQSGGNGVENSGLWGILLLVINILTASIGVAAVGGIVYGSILYTSAGGDAANVKKAKEIIVNVVIGLVAYAVMYSFLNYIIPGGLFN